MDSVQEPVRADAHPDGAAPGARHRLTYQPALDGVRGVAVALVVIFHLDVGLFGGGYLGVSVFFTLSGFLITSLLVDEWNTRADSPEPGIDLGRFYVRRLKRLMPASMATLLTVAILAAVGLVSRTASLRGDLIAAAWNVFNWRELTSGDSYAELFESESAVAHFWSLAIEEQFYVIWPVTLVFVAKRFGLGRRTLLTLLGTLFALSALSAIPASGDVTYFATWTRAAEILAGALLAAWMSTSTRPSWPTWWRWIPAPALALVVLASVFTPTSTGWAYEGGLALFALVSAGLIAGLQLPGPTTTALSWTPLVALGKVSYGVYLVHWPVFVVLDEDRLGVSGWSLAGARLLVTAVIAVVSYHLLERPIRTSTRPRSALVAGGAAIAAMGVVTVAAVALTGSDAVADPAPAVIGAPPPETDAPDTEPVPPPTTQAPGPDPVDVETASTSTSSTTTTTMPTPAPLTVAVFGDSVPAWLLRDAAASFDRTDVIVLNGAREACDGMVDLPVGRDRRGDELVPPDDCLDWTVSYPETLANADRTDVALLVIGQAPVVDHLIDDVWQGPCDGIDWYLDDVRLRIAFLRGEGVRPVLAIPAPYGQRVSFMVEDDHRERIGCVRSAMLGFAGELDLDHIDLDEFLCPAGDCDARRDADGIHVDSEFAPEVLDELLDRVVQTMELDAA